MSSAFASTTELTPANADENSSAESLDLPSSTSPKTTKKPQHNTTLISLTPSLTLFILITSYFIWAGVHYSTLDDFFDDTTCNGFGFIVILYCFYLFGTLYSFVIKPFCVPTISKYLIEPVKAKLTSIKYGAIIFYVLAFGAIIGYLIYDTSDNRRRLISGSGLIVFMIFGFLTSHNKRKIQWHTVMMGLLLQFVFGLVTIRWKVGRSVFQCLGDKVNTFLNYALDGSEFVYSTKLIQDEDFQVFAFRALSTIYFLAFFINILYYYGIMQVVVSFIGNFLQWILKTSICESVNSAANIFLGQTEAPLLLKPYLKHLTDSELHSIMTSGFATVSGTVMAAYITFGATADNLITSSVMSAPAALCYSKLNYPETEDIVVTKDNIEVDEGEYSGVMDAATRGASEATNIVLGIISSIIAFLAFIGFINGAAAFFLAQLGYTFEDDILELVVGYIFTPVSYLMGVPWEDCENVGRLIGLKTMINEFVAFSKMKDMGLTGRTKTIATYAICGFSNPASIGIQISGLGALIPQKREAIIRLVFRAFVGGAIVCFMTACIAGLLIPDELI